MAQHKLIDLDLLTHYDEKIKELISSEEENTTYSLSAGTGADAEKIVLTDSDGNEDKVTVPYATKAGDADTVNGEVPDNIFKGTTVEWEALTTEQKKTYDATLFSDDYDEPDHMDADVVVYNNASSGLSADNVQDAVDEVNGKFATLGTASSKDVPTSGNASSTQVVMGSDTRLTNARPASDVSAWAKESTKPTYTASEVGAIATSEKGSANGVAELDENGIVITSQLPSYVDDVLEYDSISDFPASGESGKIYVAKDTNITYRWSGTTYVEISPSLALGETSSTAYRGDRGKTAYDHATDSNRLTIAQTSGLYKIATTSEGHVASVSAVQKSDITGLGIPGEDTNTTYTLSAGTGADSEKVVLTPSSGDAQKITVPFATDASTVNGNTVPVDFIGTTAEWEQKTTEQKKGYDRTFFTDD